MLRINQFHFEPGLYELIANQNIHVVVTELVTHSDNGELKEFEDPLVVFRDLETRSKVETYVRYSMKLSEFKSKYKLA